jgi:chromosome segregation ATPase
VQKVIQLIDDMHAKVTKEAAEESKVFEEYAKFCDDEATAKEYAIKDSKEAIEELTATITDSKAIIESEDSKVGDLSTKISDTESELSNAVAVRNKEHDEFVKTEKELVETVEELAGAQKAIEKSMSFIQARGGKMSVQDGEVLNAVVQSLGQIVEASFVSQKQKDHIAALLQSRADAQEDAEFGSGSMGSGGVNAILDTLKEMEDKAEASLTEVRKGESEGQMNGAMLKQGLENEIKNLNKEKDESTSKSASTAQALAQAEKDIAVEKQGLAEDEKYLRDLKRDCQSRAGEFEVEAKDNQAELKALEAAKAILLKKFAAFVQVRARVAVRDDVSEDAKARALKSIELLGKRLHSTALVALAYRAAADPFGKIRGMIEEMIAKLLQEAAEEATQKAFCDKEIGESKAVKAEKEGKLDKVNARLEKSNSATATLTEDVSKLSAEVAENDKAMAAATEVRQKEKADFMVVEKDLSESQEACAAAMEVLREYYEGASLVQVSAKAHARARSAEAADAEGDGSGILGVLEVAESDFAKGLAEARTIEQQSQSEYDKMMQDGKMLKMTKEMEIKGKQSELKSIKTTLTDLSEDKTGLTGELDAVLAYLDKLKPQCEVKVPSYEERKAAREQEIEGLKNALDILSEPALVQTGFLQ